MGKQEKKLVEDPVVKKALELLLVPSIPLKMNRGVETGRPDQLFLIPHGKPLFIEFKWPGEPIDPKQLYWHQVLKDLGYEVQTHDNVDEALEAIASKVVAASLHAKGRKIPFGTWRSHPDARPRFEEDLHYTRSVQFLEKAWRRKEAARCRAPQSRPSSLARRDR